jgi:hypothetical protein
MELLLAEAPLLVRAAEPIGSGRSGGRRLLVELPGGPVVRVKWKAAGRGGDGYNRSPRHEIAAYRLQQLFLTPDEYVVPPTVARCLSKSEIHELGDHAKPTFSGGHCVLGSLSYWLEDAHQLAPFSTRRFHSDPIYRRRVALLDVLTHLIDHRDTKPQNFVAAAGRAFSVDNGMSFSGWRTPRGWFARGWQDVIVDELPRDLVARLRRITPAQLSSELGTVAELRVRDGRLEPVAPEPPFDTGAGVRRRGDRIQLGLTQDEIDGVWGRLQRLLERVDTGDIGQF